MNHQHKTRVSEDEFFSLREVEQFLSNQLPANHLTLQYLLRCITAKKCGLYFPYRGALQIRFDPLSENSDNQSRYSYSGHLEILDYKYGTERDGYFVTAEVRPYDLNSLIPRKGSFTVSELTNRSDYHFYPLLEHSHTTCNQLNQPSIDCAEVFFMDLRLSSMDTSVVQLVLIQYISEITEKQKNEGRYNFEDSAAIIASKCGVDRLLVEGWLFDSIKDDQLHTYLKEVKAPITNPSPRFSLESILLNELYWDDLNIWLKQHFPKLTYEFPKPSPLLLLKLIRRAHAKGQIRSVGMMTCCVNY